MTTTITPSPAAEPHPADSHDLIRVHGARVNNLDDISIEIPKRRLTVFTSPTSSSCWACWTAWSNPASRSSSSSTTRR